MVNKTGLSNPNVIDLITLRQDGTLVLIMTEERPWDGSMTRLAELQAKVNAYLSFIMDGHWESTFPGIKPERYELQLDCSHEPDLCTLNFISHVNDVLKKFSTQLIVSIR